MKSYDEYTNQYYDEDMGKAVIACGSIFIIIAIIIVASALLLVKGVM